MYILIMIFTVIVNILKRVKKHYGKKKKEYGDDEMTENRFIGSSGGVYDQYKKDRFIWSEWEEIIQIMNNLNEKARERSKALSKLQKENEQLKEDLKRCRNWLNSDKYDYELTLAFIKNKGYSLKDVLEYEKELKE